MARSICYSLTVCVPQKYMLTFKPSKMMVLEDGTFGKEKKKKKHEWISAFMKELREMLCPVHKVDTAATNQALIKYNYAHVSILDVSDSINVSNTFLLFISQPGCSIAQCLLLVAQLCPTLCDPMDCSLPGFSVGKRRDSMGSLQVRIVEY